MSLSKAVRRMAIGVNDPNEFLTNPAEAVRRAKQLGARQARLIVTPKEGLDKFQPAIDQLTQAGIKPSIALSGYQNEGFVRDALKRWGKQAASVSFWNEPNWVSTQLSARDYASKYRRGQALAKRLAPNAKLYAGDLAPTTALDYLKQLQPYKLRADDVAIHPYQFTAAPNKKADPGGIGQLSDYLRAAKGMPGHPGLAVTEFGYFTPGSGDGRAVNPQTAGQWMRRAVNLAAKAHAQAFMPYHLSAAPEDANWDTSLVDQTGRRRPAWYAVKGAARR